MHYHEARKPAWTRSEADKLKCAFENEKIEVINTECTKIEKNVADRDTAKLYGEYGTGKKAPKSPKKANINIVPAAPVAAVH